MLGAEVDFYIEGMEYQTEKVVELIYAFYEDNRLLYKENKEYLIFQAQDPAKFGLTKAPLTNKEIVIKVFQSHEGRDFDNSHTFPYLCLQVRFDRNSNTRVLFDEKMSRNYLRR